MAKIEWIEIAGFRAYAEPQRLEVGGPLAVIWAPNSQGKTSTAEAIEFLLTGSIARRELMASTRDEFANSLRNVHADEQTSVYVTGCFTGTNDQQHIVTRQLVEDYSKRGDCTSTLKVDGVASTEADLAALGLVLSQPPTSLRVVSTQKEAWTSQVK